MQAPTTTEALAPASPPHPTSVSPATSLTHTSPTAHPQVARYRVLGRAPSLTHTVQVTEALRKALMSHSDAAPVFSGRGRDGSPERGHQHAFFLPEANDPHERITHITTYAPMGFNTRAQRALQRVTRIWSRDLRASIDVKLLGCGTRSDFAGMHVGAGQSARLVPAIHWLSRTPFVPTRHPKRRRTGQPKRDPTGRWRDCPSADLARLIQTAGLPRPVAIDALTHTFAGGRWIAWSAFRTQRASGGGRRAPVQPVGFAITFAEPVTGPIALGYGAHYGLGAFWPAAAAEYRYPAATP